VPERIFTLSSSSLGLEQEKTRYSLEDKRTEQIKRKKRQDKKEETHKPRHDKTRQENAK
jgi:hypothetical protein